MLLACTLTMGACSDDDDSSDGAIKPSKTTEQAFQRDFPTAEHVTWSKKKGYDVATFVLPAGTRAEAMEHSAWYIPGTDKNAYTKMEISWDQLRVEAPLVADAWLASSYKADGYVLDDEIDVKTYAGCDPLYKLEAELGEKEYELIYKKDGSLVSEVLDDDDSDEDMEDDPCPVQILDFVRLHFPKAQIEDASFESDFGFNYYVVEIEERIEGREVDSDLLFTERMEFWRMTREIEEQDVAKLPAEVLDGMRKVAAEDTWDEVTAIMDINGNVLGYYLEVEIENETTDTEEEHFYEFGLDGQLIKQFV